MAYTNYTRNAPDNNRTLSELKALPGFEMTATDISEYVQDRTVVIEHEIRTLEDQYSIRNYLDFHQSMKLNRLRIELEAMRITWRRLNS